MADTVAAPGPSGRPENDRLDRGPGLRVLVTSGSAELYGSDRVMLETVDALARAGDRVVVAAGADGPLLEVLRRCGASTVVQDSPVLRRSYLSPRGLVDFASVVARTMPRMGQLLHRLRPDVMYVNTMTMPVWALLGRMCGIPVVTHVHEAEAGQAAPLRRLLATGLHASSTVVFNSETSRELARADCVGSVPPSVVVLNPVVPVAGPETVRGSLDTPVRLLYMGRVSERKGVDLALEATASCAARGLDVTLDVVGDVFPGYEPFLRRVQARAAEPDLAGRVTFHGFHRDVGPFVERADIVLVPSRADESFGNVLVEAVSAGRPVVAAGQSGLREAGRGTECVIYVDPGRAEPLADAVMTICADWTRWREAAVRDARLLRHRHDPRRYADEVVAVLRRAARRRRPAGRRSEAGGPA